MDRAEHARLAALSPLDGRYAQKLDALRDFFGEFALIRDRVRVEIAWLVALADEPAIAEVPAFSPQARAALDDVAATFSPDDAARVKAIERRTNHDVKAVEYWLKERIGAVPELARVREFVHFACTSEDINNLAYALALLGARTSVLLPALEAIAADLRALAHRHAAVPMLARTHGQAATPTTLGKEMANFCARLARETALFARVPVKGKMNGAVGNYNAHVAAYPDVAWEQLAARTVASLGLEFNPYTTQIEPHDALAEYCDALARANTVLIDLDRDVWGYVSLRQGVAKLEVDSERIAADLEANYEVLAEAIQTVMRRYGLPEPYEQLKALTRGRTGMTPDAIRTFVASLELPDDAKQRLLALTPATYVGLAGELARRI